MKKIKNNNGSTYYIISEFYNNNTNDNILLLASYGGKAEDEIQAGASLTQYIVARGWNDKYKSWDSAKYFLIWKNDQVAALKSALECFQDNINRILYSIH